MINLFKYWHAVSCFLLFAACDSNIVYHSYQAIPDQGWPKDDTLTFPININDSMPSTYQLSTEVRNNNKYPYQNLFLIIRHNLPDSTHFRTDTLEMTLSDSTGRWLGKGWGNIFQSEKLYHVIKQVPPGDYTLQIINNMNTYSLHGINNIGIRIEKLKD